jgi:hypothetical protein
MQSLSSRATTKTKKYCGQNLPSTTGRGLYFWVCSWGVRESIWGVRDSFGVCIASNVFSLPFHTENKRICYRFMMSDHLFYQIMMFRLFFYGQFVIAF